MHRFGIWEIAIILVVVLILFGGKKIPDIARNLGKGLSEFKKGLKEIESDVTKTDDKEDHK